MITGYNTDVEHGGVIYHVQTEDKGLQTPIVLSLVYSGGAILAAKRASYQDLIADGFSEAALAERLQRQHRLICAAINSGRLEDLKRLSNRDTKSLPPLEEIALEQPESAAGEITRPVESAGNEVPEEPPAEKAETPLPAETGASPSPVHDSRRKAPWSVEEEPAPVGLRITLVGREPVFQGGEAIDLQALITRVSDTTEEPVSGATVSIKILGTTFRPVLHSLKTNREGLVNLLARIPPFTSGRAAILIKVAGADLAAETRWVVNPGK